MTAFRIWIQCALNEDPLEFVLQEGEFLMGRGFSFVIPEGATVDTVLQMIDAVRPLLSTRGVRYATLTEMFLHEIERASRE